MFEKIKNIWKEYGFNITLVASLVFIFGVWLFCSRKKKSGTFSSVNNVLENINE